MKIKKVAIVGGTHGNEFTGTYLLKKWERSNQEILRKSFRTKLLWSNPRAFYLSKRYVDEDLNRCFRQQDLENESLDTYEANRAKVINAILGPKGKAKYDFVIDMHTTTSNMGETIVVYNNPFTLKIASYLKVSNPNVRVLYDEIEGNGAIYLDTITPFGVTIEIGPIANGVISHRMIEQTRRIVKNILDFIHACNEGKNLGAPKRLEVFHIKDPISFPRDEESGEILGMIHENLDSKDYMELKTGDPLFYTLEDNTIFYENEDVVYPVFINEAGYYKKNIALFLTEKKVLNLSSANKVSSPRS